LPTTNKTTITARDSQVIAAIKKDLSTVSSMPLAGATYTPTTLTDLIQSRINAVNAVAAARANWLAAVATFETVSTQVHAVEAGLKTFVMNLFGKTSPLLADFGYTAPKVTVQTTEEKQAAVLKRAATRKARNTLSKKAKSKITGVVAPPAQPAAPTEPATTPAPTTPTVNLIVSQAPASPSTPTTVTLPEPVAPTAPPKS
jgi:hypothetical protein